MIRENIIFSSLIREVRMRVELMLKVTMLGRDRAGLQPRISSHLPSVPWCQVCSPTHRLSHPPSFHLVLLSTQLFNRFLFWIFICHLPHTIYILMSCPFYFWNITQICSLSISLSKPVSPLTWTMATTAYLASSSTLTFPWSALHTALQTGGSPQTHIKFCFFPA